MSEDTTAPEVNIPNSPEIKKDESDKLSTIKNSFKGEGRQVMGKDISKIIPIVIAGIIVLVVAYFFTNKGDGIFRSPIGSENGEGSSTNQVVNPLSGEIYTENEAKDWKDIRPLAVMVNNHVDARPQSGLIYADLVYEIVAEGGITRMLPFFQDTVPEKIGPVRSTREYYLVLVKELGDAMLMHIGWSPQALAAIESWPVRSLGRGGGSFWRDTSLNVATEHTAYVNGKELVETGLKLGWEGTRETAAWQFKDDSDAGLPAQAGKYGAASSTSEVSIDFWFKGDYSAVFKYNSENNSYMRFMGYDADDNPISHADRDTGEQIEVKNLIVQFVAESPIIGDDKGRLEYELVGSGTGFVFIDGKVIDVTWNKEGRDERTMFYDLNGEEIMFNRGMFWISVVADRNIEQVVYN